MAPLRRRLFDTILIASFLGFATTSFVFDPYTALDVDLSASSAPPAQLIHWFATHVDPLVLHPPLFVRIMVAVSVLIFGPTYLLLAYGLWRKRAWVRPLGIAYASAKLYSMVVYLAVAIPGARDELLFAAVYLPYLLVPIALLVRVLKADDLGERSVLPAER